MAALSPKLRSVAFSADGSKTGVAFWCPGCDKAHPICTSGGSPSWTWDSNINIPTFSPSIRVTYDGADAHTVCHSFVRAGAIEFLGDCTHALLGQTVPLPDWPSND